MIIDESYIRTAHPSIQDVLYNTLYNMSWILEDKGGQLQDKNAKNIIHNLQVSPVGEVIGLDYAPYLDVVLGDVGFAPKLSQYAFEVYRNLTTPDSKFVFQELYEYNSPDSIIDTFSKGLPQEAKSYMCYMYLELYAMYLSTVNYTDSTTRISSDEITSVINNANYIKLKCDVGNQEEVYGYLQMIGNIQKTMMFLKKGLSLITSI